MSEISAKLVGAITDELEWSNCAAKSNVSEIVKGIIDVTSESNHTQFIINAICVKCSSW